VSSIAGKGIRYAAKEQGAAGRVDLRAGRRGSHRIGAQMAGALALTIIALLVAMTPALGVTSASASGNAVLLASPSTTAPGNSIAVSGSGFAKNQKGIVILDSSTNGAAFRANAKGAFSVTLSIPATEPTGQHNVYAQASSTSSTASSGTSLASTTISVSSGPTLTPTSAPTLAPTPAPTPTPVPTPTATPTPTPTVAPNANPSPSASPTGFVRTQGTSLTLNGAPYRFTGFSIYNANSRWNCWYPLGFNDSALSDTLTSIGSGQEVFRAWFYTGLAGTPTVRDWAAFDHTLAVAKAHGMKVIASLSGEGGDCKDYPVDVHKYEAWYAGAYAQPEADGESYLDWVREVVARYKDDPTILAWQMMGEAEDPVDSTGACSSTANQTLKSWADTTAGVIKSIDPNHLVTVGVIGSGQCGASGTAFQNLHAGSNIDLCTREDYGSPTVPMPGDQWNGMQVRIDECHALGKAIFVSETGIARTDPNRASEWSAKFSAQFSAGVVGELIWDWSNSSISDGFEVLPGDPVLPLLSQY
jgi:mannan endo-1,4-beta-mannosidase